MLIVGRDWPVRSQSRVGDTGCRVRRWSADHDQPEEPSGVQSFSDVTGDCVAGPGLADCRRLGPVVAGDRIFGDDPAVRRGQTTTGRVAAAAVPSAKIAKAWG
jgi:hypothetical protein